MAYVGSVGVECGIDGCLRHFAAEFAYEVDAGGWVNGASHVLGFVAFDDEQFCDLVFGEKCGEWKGFMCVEVDCAEVGYCFEWDAGTDFAGFPRSYGEAEEIGEVDGGYLRDGAVGKSGLRADVFVVAWDEFE